MVYLWQFIWILSKNNFGFLRYMLNTFAYLIGLDLVECVLFCKTTFWKSHKKTLYDDFKFLLIGDLILHIKVRNAHEIFFSTSFIHLFSPLSSPLCVQSRKRVNLHGRTRIHLSEKKINPPGEFFQRCVIVHMLQILYTYLVIFQRFHVLNF